MVESATFDVVSSGGSAPAPPTGVSAAASSAAATVSWTASQGASTYTVRRSTTSGGPYTVAESGITATSYLNVGLTNGTAYYFVVTAVNSYGESAYSAEVSATPTAAAQGYDMSYTDGSLTLTDAEEYASVPSTSYVNGVVSTSNQHVFQLSLLLPSGVGWAAGHQNDPSPGNQTPDGNYYCIDSVCRPLSTSGQTPYWLNPPPGYYETNPGPLTQPNYSAWNAGADAANDTCLPGNSRPGGVIYSVYVVAPGCAGFGGSGANVQLTQNGAGQPALMETITPGQTVLVQEESAGALPAGTIQVVLTAYKWWHTLLGYYQGFNPVSNGQGGYTYTYSDTKYFWAFYCSTTYKVYTFNLRRSHADSASIDSRLTYGNPDITGEIQADANSSGRNPIFNPYTFHGGLFVGNMPFGGADESGTARVETFGDIAANSQTIWATFTAFYIGYPSAAGNTARICLFAPADNDGNINIASNMATWANRWGVSVTSSYLDFTTSTPVNVYYNWRLFNPSTVAAKVGLRLDNEASSVPEWCYFASPSWEAAQTTWPGNDSRPRVWMVDEPPVGGWTQ